MKKSKVEKQTLKTPLDPVVTVVTTLKELVEMATTPKVIRLKMGEKSVEFAVCRLTAEQEEERLGILRKHLPPLIRNGPDGKPLARPEYDQDNPEFQAKLEKQMRIARSVAVYRGCRILQSAESLSHEAITSRLQSQLPDLVLERIYSEIVDPDVEVADRANFTTAPESPGS
jgi:hypothetical protein